MYQLDETQKPMIGSVGGTEVKSYPLGDTNPVQNRTLFNSA